MTRIRRDLIMVDSDVSDVLDILMDRAMTEVDFVIPQTPQEVEGIIKSRNNFIIEKLLRRMHTVTIIPQTVEVDINEIDWSLLSEVYEMN